MPGDESKTTKPTEPVKRKRQTLINELKVAKKYCFDDLVFDELDETEIPEKTSSLIRKIVEGPTIAKLEAISYCIGKLGNGLSTSLTFEEIFDLVTKLNETIEHCKIHDDVTAYCIYVSLLVYANEDMPTALYVEDYINDIISYFKCQLDELVVYFLKKGGSVKKRSNSTPNFAKFLVKNLGKLEKFVGKRNFSCNLYNLVVSCLQVIFHVFVYDVQVEVLGVLRGIFEKRKDLRGFVLGEIFGLMKKLPENYKFIRNFVVGEVNVSMFTVMILEMIQSVGKGKKVDEAVLQEVHENVIKVSGMIAVNFVGKCGSDVDQHKVYRGILDFFMGELLEISGKVEWPAGKILLQMLAKPLTEIAKGSNDVFHRVFALKLLNKIGMKLIKNRKYEAEIGNILEEFKEVPEFDDLEIAQILLILHLKHENLESVKCVYQAQWYENAKHFDEDRKNFVLNISQRSNLISKKITKPEAEVLVWYVDSKRFNFADFHVFLNYILNACYDGNKKIKAAGAQCLAELINLDPGLLSKKTVSKTLSECLSATSAVSREAICKLLGKYLLGNLEKTDEYNVYLLKMLGDESILVRKTCISAIQNLVLKKWDIPYSKEMCYKTLGMIRDEDLNVQKQVTEFLTSIWFDEEIRVDLLLAIVEMPNALKNLRLFLEEKLKPKIIKVTEATQTEPETETVDTCETLIAILLKKMPDEKCKLSILKIFSIIAIVYPKILTPHVLLIAEPLNQTKYTKDFAVEILTAETLNYILPEMVAPDVLALILLIDKLIDKLTSCESLAYTMGFTISILKLLKKLSPYAEDNFLQNKLFSPNLARLEKYFRGGEGNEKEIIRAISICTYLHVDLSDKKFPLILRKLLEDTNYCLATIHSVCYLSIDCKLIMKNVKLNETIGKYLKERRKYVLTQAVLHNILCALKNNSSGDGEIITDLVQKYSGDVLECGLDPNFDIRYTACLLISHILKSRLSIDLKYLPYVITMSTDPIPSINNMGMELLKALHTRKTYDFSRSPQKGILMSRKLISKISGSELIRGYREQNGRFESRCNLLYVLHREDETKRRRLTESILNELKPESLTSAMEKLYLIDHLSCFTYKYQDEILYLMRQIEHIKSVTMIPDDVPADREKFLREYYGCYLLIPLKKYLQKLYGINDLKISKYYGIEGKKDLITRRPGIDHFITEDMLPNGLEDLYDALKSPDITDSSQSSNDERPAPKSVLKEKLINERFTKSEQKPKKLKVSFNFASAKKPKSGKSGNSTVAKSLF